MKALLLVDLQNDLLPGGAIPVPQGDAILPLVNQLQGAFRLVVATQDWHPPNHKSFAVHHPGRKPGDTVVLKKVPHRLWSAHCVQTTRGAELAPGLMMNRVNRVFRRGTEPELDGYSAYFDNGHTRATGLSDYFRDKRVTDVYVAGLGTEDCIKATVMDSISFGLNTFVIEDACRGWNFQPDDSRSALNEMKQAGASVIHSREVLQNPKIA
jgi:nicotinamidase/pyrazinamidase